MLQILDGFICREYEARIAELQEMFGQEQANKEQLQLELNRLQEQRDKQLTAAEVRGGGGRGTMHVNRTAMIGILSLPLLWSLPPSINRSLFLSPLSFPLPLPSSLSLSLSFSSLAFPPRRSSTVQ